MPRKVIGYNGFVDLFRNPQKHGIPELLPEEEDREVIEVFMTLVHY